MDTALIEQLEAEIEALETNEEIVAFKERLVEQYGYSPLDSAIFVGITPQAG